MVRIVPDARAEMLGVVATEAAAKIGGDAVEFATRYFAQVPDDDLAVRPPRYLALVARMHWELARHRPPRTALVAVTSPPDTPHTLVQVVNDDMPFLVDSIRMELARQGFGLHLVVHPVLRVRRTSDGALVGLADERAPGDDILESFVCVEIDRETTPAALTALREGLLAVLADVRCATGDWLKMLARLQHVVDELAASPPPIDADDVAEGRALLEWMGDQHFTFLGYRQYELGAAATGDVLRPVPGTALGILRNAPEESSRSFEELPPDIRAHARDRELLVLTKTNRRSTVHRPTYLDYVGVRTFGVNGSVTGEHRFLGLFTSTAYNTSPIDIPVLRRKVAAVVDRAGFLPASHDHKDLIAILETFPRDDLFWIDVDTLYDTAISILQLQERRRVRVFVHRETFGRFVSVLVFLPRDRYATPVRERISDLLVETFGARNHEWNTRLSESVLARLHFVLHVDPNDRRLVDVDALEARIAALTRAWTDDLRDALVAGRGEEDGLELFREWSRAFPAAYQEDFDAAEALADIGRIETLDDSTPVAARLDENGTLSLKVYGIGAQPSLSEILPRLTNMGVTVDDETPYDLCPADGMTRWLKHFRLRAPVGAVGSAAAARAFEAAFLAVGRGDAEDDGFNRLVLAAGLSWREVALLRAYSRYLRQIGSVYSQSYIEDALVAHAGIARALVELFVARLDPWNVGHRDTDLLVDEVNAALDAVTSLDEDRILRALLHLVLATLRTNWFRTLESGEPSPTLVVKLDPARIPDLPAPRPMFELFVYSPRVEGVHLSAAKVARGGIRWSDRREDYRTEILGLMKAQRVKNVVIVPGGAKGGFVVKRPPADRDALAAEVEACYRLFVASLLEVTDNLVDGVVVPPPDVVRYDGDDPYLVVAADKGTAAFSDLANEIALARGFWLGDAFASGGSAGYDHKKMGITARGAWESVKRHFRELGVDVQASDFTVVGIGDMSGDVFGNGMLLSRHIRLVAAFDHRHVFLDPDPDPETSFAERERLFALPRSSWDDYDRGRLSPGGGIYPRSAKSISLTPEVRAALAIDDDVVALAPNDLIRAILTAPVDLLWNGGIGTYVKARAETHADVGDKANDGVRVDGAELRARVVAEGGNLGLTQRGRVEYALGGGLVNTDAIDNSAGVDASDHEVNIKILLGGVVESGLLTTESRNALLRQMTDEVAALVLRDNYRQNRALANARAQAPGMIDVHTRFIHALVQSGHLDRTLERLPDDETLADRRNAGTGLTVPELAVLLAYAKIALEDDVLESSVPDDPYFAQELHAYFPGPLRERYADLLAAHPLRREIVTTALVNGMVNRAGTTFAFRLAEETGASAADIVRAHEVARVVFGQAELWHAIEHLDNEVAADVQTAMYLESRRLIERSSRWLLRRWARPLPVAEAIAFFRPGVRDVAATLRPADDDVAALTARGVPADLARQVTLLGGSYCALDITDLAATWSRPVPEVTSLWSTVGDRLQVDWLRERIVELPRGDRWQALARGALRDDVESEHRAVTAAVLNAGGDFDAWAKNAQPALARVLALLDDIRAHGVYDLATLSVALREIRNLV